VKNYFLAAMITIGLWKHSLNTIILTFQVIEQLFVI